MGTYKRTKFDEEQGKSSMICCGLCYLTLTQKRICYTVIAAPFLALLLLVLVILIFTFTVEEKFQLEQILIAFAANIWLNTLILHPFSDFYT